MIHSVSLLLTVLGFVALAIGSAVLCRADASEMEQTHNVNSPSGSLPTGGLPINDTTQFLATVLAATEDVWNGIFFAEGLQYEEPKLILYSGQISSACGPASWAHGPSYCPDDRKVYLDPAYFGELNKLGISGDFALAFLIAKEVGHHVQNLTGILPKFNQMRQRMSRAEANQMSVRVELQADCFAGVWGYHIGQKGFLDKGDVEEAINAAHQLGDDAIQKRLQGYVVPETFLQGTSEQRVNWFNRGFRSGQLSACDTFNNPV